MKPHARGLSVVAALAVAGSLAATALAPSPGVPTWTFAAGPTPALPAQTAAPAAPGPADNPQLLVAAAPDPTASTVNQADPADDSATNSGNDGDEGVDPTLATLAALSPADGRIQLYPERPSILPGQSLRLHASTTARSYSLTVTREGAPERVVFRHTYTGHNYSARVTFDASTNTTRANWPMTAAIPTAGWRTGIYTVKAVDSLGRTSGAIVVVRDATPSRSKALFVLPVMDYQAYNAWGGSNFYNTGIGRSIVVSWDRPYNANAGLSYLPAYDRYTLRWLEGHGYPLSYTTDYDLAMSPPKVAPKVLIIPQHTEYVTRSLYDWVDTHVNVIGDMNVAYFGANSFYWQVRLVADPRGGAHIPEMLSYKSRTADPITAIDPSLTTCRWRDTPLARPETGLFGAMYSGIVDGGYTRHDMTITAAVPAWALSGTGWKAGTVLRGMMLGETDMADASAGGIAIASGRARYYYNSGAYTILTGNMTLRVSPAGARSFDAGTFAWGKLLAGGWNAGVSAASFDRFNRNILAWLGLRATK